MPGLLETGGSGTSILIIDTHWLTLIDMYHSFDYANIHFTAISTESIYSKGSGQWQWIESDLKEAGLNFFSSSYCSKHKENQMEILIG
jgi:hypothetical protein